MQNLVVVESPTKARTLQRFLGSEFQIEASMGHVRDLPKSEFGVDVEHDFKPEYVIPKDKRKNVNILKKLASSAKTLYLATDPDREGEAIAWHISELLRNSEKPSSKLQVPNEIHRVVFHEITEGAIKEAFKHPHEIDLKLVDAQQARRILDRLVGYKLSPLLWQKVKKGLSAGRVQSVTLRLIVEREREIGKFKPVEYWIIEAELSKHLRGETKDAFIATLIEKDGKKVEIKNKQEADGHVKNLEKARYFVSKITQKELRRYPYHPFITSTLQQVASNRLGYSAKKTMMLAQALYEQGFISYMRTDSVNLSPSAIASARSYIEQYIGKAYLPKVARVYKSRSKNAQEAHEAIRPTDVEVKGEGLRGKGLNRDHQRLYDLIWKRFVACQMSEALLDQTTVDVTAAAYLLRATGSVIRFEGWLKLYGKEADENSSREAGEDDKKQALPDLSENDPLNLLQLIPNQHFTEPPPRYNEASLIKKLEELGIGRPSTYAPIISTILDRFYVERQERKFIPTSLGFAVTDFLIEFFPNIVDYSFTAKMEDDLDEIARGEIKWQPIIRQFYSPFAERVEKAAIHAEKIKMEVELAGKKCPECGNELVIRIGKFGKFLACSTFPKCRHTEAIEEKIDAKCPLDGGQIVVRHTRRGKTFYGCKNWPVCKFASWTKPKSEKMAVDKD